MSIPVYLPQKVPFWHPAVNQTTNFLWNLLGQNLQYGLQRRLGQERLNQQKELLRYGEQLKEQAKGPVKGQPFVTPEGERVVPVYSKNYKQVTKIPLGKQRVETKKPGDQWQTLKPFKYGGALIYPQVNLTTGELKLNRLPPAPQRASKGGPGSPEISRQIQGIQDQMNELRKLYGIGKVDTLAVLTLPAKERKAWLKSQTEPILQRIKNPNHRIRYVRLMKRLGQLVEKQAGGLPELKKGSTEDALKYLQQAGGDENKAKTMALMDGIILE